MQILGYAIRIIGYLFLIMGFIITPAWFNAEYHAIRGEVMGNSVALVRSGGETKTYTWPEWRDIVDKAFDKTKDSIPSNYPPAIAMLIGAILLDIGSRLRKRQKTPPNKSLQPTATAPPVLTEP